MVSGSASVAASVAASAAPPVHGQPRPQRPAMASTARVVSGRGVTGRGIIVLTLLGSALVGLLEVAVAGHRGHLFAIAFVATTAASALVVRRKDIRTAMVAPPLLYCVLIVLVSAFDTNGETGGFLTREGVYVGNAFVTGAPTLWAGTAAAVVIGWYRRRASAPRRSPK